MPQPGQPPVVQPQAASQPPGQVPGQVAEQAPLPGIPQATPPTPAPLPARAGAAVAPVAPVATVPGSNALPATPQGLAAMSPGGGRKDVWLSEPFRCRAISTVRLRKCQFEETGTGHQLRFNKKDVICDEVVFDENGDPEELRSCHSSWLRVPRNNKLRSDKDHKIWSGSHKGWFWKGSGGGKYCCPGLWIEAPKSLQ